MPLIELETRINAPINLVFDLARSIDLHKISTVKSKEKAIAGTTTGLININETVTWRAKHFGIWQELTSKITQFDRPNLFVDEMQKGIFNSLRHEHIFKEEDQGTIMIDRFDYVSPLWILGIIADRLFLKAYMCNFLVTRNKMIKDFAESEQWREVPGLNPS